MKKTYKTKIFAAIHETAEGLHRADVVDKKTMREFDESCLMPVEKLAPEQIRAIREESLTSQSVFARFLGVTPGLVSQWERGEKSPSGPSLKLLALVKTKGLDAIAHYAQDETEETEEIEETEDVLDVAAAERRGLESQVREAHAVAARYNAATSELCLTLRGGARLSIAVEMLQGVAGADPQLIEQVELWGDGSALHWEALDADLLVQDIVAGSFGTRRWMGELEERGLLDAASIERRRKVAELQEQFARDRAAKAALSYLGDIARLTPEAEATRAIIGKSGQLCQIMSVTLVERKTTYHASFSEAMARAAEVQGQIKGVDYAGNLRAQVGRIRMGMADFEGKTANIRAIAQSAAEQIRIVGHAQTLAEQTDTILAAVALATAQFGGVGFIDIADDEGHLVDEFSPKQSKESESSRDRELYPTLD